MVSCLIYHPVFPERTHLCLAPIRSTGVNSAAEGVSATKQMSLPSAVFTKYIRGICESIATAYVHVRGKILKKNEAVE